MNIQTISPQLIQTKQPVQNAQTVEIPQEQTQPPLAQLSFAGAMALKAQVLSFTSNPNQDKLVELRDAIVDLLETLKNTSAEDIFNDKTIIDNLKAANTHIYRDLAVKYPNDYGQNAHIVSPVFAAINALNNSLREIRSLNDVKDACLYRALTDPTIMVNVVLLDEVKDILDAEIKENKDGMSPQEKKVWEDNMLAGLEKLGMTRT